MVTLSRNDSACLELFSQPLLIGMASNPKENQATLFQKHPHLQCRICCHCQCTVEAKPNRFSCQLKLPFIFMKQQTRFGFQRVKCYRLQKRIAAQQSCLKNGTRIRFTSSIINFSGNTLGSETELGNTSTIYHAFVS